MNRTLRAERSVNVTAYGGKCKSWLGSDPGMARGVYVSAPPASSVTVTVGQRVPHKVPAERTRQVTLDTGGLCGHSGQKPKGQAGACPDRTRAIPCNMQAVTTATRTRAPKSQASSAKGSHGNERLPECLDVPGQPTGTRPRSRTDLNQPGSRYGDLRIRRLEVRVPPSAQPSTQLSALSPGFWAR
jgi:hypothetical protein